MLSDAEFQRWCDDLRLTDATLRDPPAPPPSVEALARHLGCPAVKLRQRFPERCRRISVRWRAHRADQGRRRRQARPAAIRRAVFALHAQGQYPSQKRVRAVLALPQWCWGTPERAAWWAARRACGWG